MSNRETITLASVAALLLVIVLVIVGAVLIDLIEERREEDEGGEVRPPRYVRHLVVDKIPPARFHDPSEQPDEMEWHHD